MRRVAERVKIGRGVCSARRCWETRIQARDRLRLLARLTEPRTDADGEELPLSPLALAHCFDRLAVELDTIVHAAHWPGRA